MAPAGQVGAAKGGETRTSIDALVELLKTKGKMELSNIAVSLGVDSRVIESWAKVLEGGGLVKISYEVGKMYLEPVTLTEEGVATARKKLDVEKGILTDNLSLQKISIDKFSESINNLSMEVTSIEKIYRQRMPEVEQMLAEISKVYTAVEEGNKNVERIKKKTEEEYDGVNKKITELYSKMDALSSMSVEKDVSGNMAKVNDLLKKVAEANASMNELKHNKDIFFENLNKNIDTQVADIRKQLKQASADMNAQLSESAKHLDEPIKYVKQQSISAKEISRQLREFKRNEDVAKRALSKAKIEFTDRYEKISEEMSKGKRLADTGSAEILSKLNEMKKSFGEVSKLDDSMRNLKESISTANKQLAEMKTSVAKLTEQLKALDAMSGISVERKAVLIKQISDKQQDEKSKMSGIEKSIRDAADRLGKHTKA